MNLNLDSLQWFIVYYFEKINLQWRIRWELDFQSRIWTLNCTNYINIIQIN